MKSVGHLLLLIFFMGSVLLPFATAEPPSYTHAAEGWTLGVSRGIALRNDQLEATGTEAWIVGYEWVPNVLQLRLPFGSYEVDSRGDELPLGRIRAKSIGASLWLGFGGEHWAPFVGAGAGFYSFEEQFKTAGNLENTFGAELYGGLRFRVIENLWDYLKLRASLHYHGTLLRPDIRVPDQDGRASVSLDRHSIVVMLEAVGL